MYCRNCGAQINDNDTYCFNCGSNQRAVNSTEINNVVPPANIYNNAHVVNPYIRPPYNPYERQQMPPPPPTYIPNIQNQPGNPPQYVTQPIVKDEKPKSVIKTPWFWILIGVAIIFIFTSFFEYFVQKYPDVFERFDMYQEDFYDAEQENENK